MSPIKKTKTLPSSPSETGPVGSPTSSFAKTQTLNPLCKLVVCAVIAAARNGPISERLIHPDSRPCSPPTSKSRGAVSNRCQKEINLLLDDCMLTHLCIECRHRSTKCSIFVGNIFSFRVKAACFRPCPNARESLVPPREGRQPWNRLQVATSGSPCDVLQNTTEKHGHGSPWEPGRQRGPLQTKETDSVYRSGSDGILPPSP